MTAGDQSGLNAAMTALYAAFYGHDRTSATTSINDNIVGCVVENILTAEEDALIAGGGRGELIDGRVALLTETEDDFSAAIERLTHRKVMAFMKANRATRGVVCELFLLEAAPLAAQPMTP